MTSKVLFLYKYTYFYEKSWPFFLLFLFTAHLISGSNLLAGAFALGIETFYFHDLGLHFSNRSYSLCTWAIHSPWYVHLQYSLLRLMLDFNKMVHDNYMRNYQLVSYSILATLDIRNLQYICSPLCCGSNQPAENVFQGKSKG